MTRNPRHHRPSILAACLLLAAAAGASAGRKSTAAAKEETRLTGDHLEQNVRCDRNVLHILGDASRLTVTGSCKTVVVEGSRNFIEIEDADLIDTRGDSNSVLFLNPGDRVVDHGHGNSVTPKWQQ